MKPRSLIRMIGVSLETSIMFAAYLFICACAVGLGTEFAHWIGDLF